MKKVKRFKPVIYLFLFGLGMIMLQSCAVYTPYSFSPVTIPDIVQMSKDKVPAKNIIKEIKKSHTAYNVKASEYAKLQQAGVADSVLDYMQKTHLNMIRNSQQARDSYYWNPGYYGWYGSGYGWPYYGYGYGYLGWNSPPVIILHGDHDYHGGGSHGGDHDRR